MGTDPNSSHNIALYVFLYTCCGAFNEKINVKLVPPQLLNTDFIQRLSQLRGKKKKIALGLVTETDNTFLLDEDPAQRLKSLSLQPGEWQSRAAPQEGLSLLHAFLTQ